MAQSDKLQAGVNALKAGDREQAIAFLTEAAKENRDNEMVWLYLGAALEDPMRKRQAFERVLKLNPDNEKAKIELAKLKALSAQPKPEPPKPAPKAAAPTAPGPMHSDLPPGTLTESSETFTIAGSALPITEPPKPKPTPAPEGPKVNPVMRVARGAAALTTRPFKLPFKIDGAPTLVTLRGLATKWLRMGGESLSLLFSNQLVPEQEGIPHLSLWDAMLPVLSAAFVFGTAEFVGRLIRGIFEIGFIGLGGVFVTPIFAAILGAAAVLSGLLVGAYSGQVLLERQNSRITVNAHMGSYASAILAAITIESIFRVMLHILIGITRNGGLGILALVISLALATLIGFLLNKEWLHRYELDDKTINLAALVTVGGGWLGTRIVLALFGAIFRIPFF